MEKSRTDYEAEPNPNAITEEDRAALDAFTAKLDQWRDDLAAIDHGAEREEFFLGVKGFIRFINEHADGDRLMHLLRASGRLEAYKPFFRWANGVYLRGIEYMEAGRIIAGDIHRNRVEDLVDREEIKARLLRKPTDLRELDVSEARLIVCVGCGSTPETMMYFREQAPTEAKILGLDNDTAAYNQGNQLLASQRWGDRMSIHHIAGEVYDYAEADIVHLAMSIPDKRAILDRIAKTAPNHVQITAYDIDNALAGIFYDDLESRIPDGLYVSERIETSSYLYRRKILYILKYDFEPKPGASDDTIR